MSQILAITDSNIIHNIKLSCQIPDVLQAIASQKIIAEAAQAAGIEVNEAELQEEGDKLRLEKKLFKAQDTWTWLKKHHLSVKDFEEIVENNVLSRKLANHLFSSEVEKFFYEHKLDYSTAVIYQVVFDHIDVALEMFYALQEEEITFPEIARLYIQEPELRRAYGYQGVQYHKDLRPEIAAAVFASSPPGILKPITTPKGVYLVWVEEVIQPQLDKQLREKIINELFAEWLKKEVDFLNIATQLDVEAIQPQDELLSQA
ncbi:peptidylprolyl isomerase [Okeanomitos corallinicola TIOX110]|uniref:peptidylprolyl isomerase n=1 Tax=Okeanomitos corallinicola TIOX110 TaxID=3133117 RepID=A0ABZ2UVK4_9CYAN